MTRRQVVALFGVTLLSACGGGGDAAETVDGGVSGGTDEPGVTADAVVALAVAPSRLCVVTRDRTVRCGARDADGVPGDLEPIAGLTDIVQLSLGEAHGCALDRAGAAEVRRAETPRHRGCWWPGRTPRAGSWAREGRDVR